MLVFSVEARSVVSKTFESSGEICSDHSSENSFATVIMMHDLVRCLSFQND